MRDKDNYFRVGVITSPHGLRGEVQVFSTTDFPMERFKTGSNLLMRKAGETPFRELVVKRGRPHKNLWIVEFEGVNSVDEVEAWRTFELCVNEDALQPLSTGSYYFHQLLGLRVVAIDGRDVGTLIEVLTPGANDVYVVKGNLQKDNILLPAIPSCITSVDLERKLMTVNLLPGLLDEDEV